MSAEFVAEDWDPADLTELLPAVEPEKLRQIESPGTAASTSAATVPAVALPDRTWRMLETALRNYRVVILVGPPGVGKGVTAAALVDQVREDPERFGFEDRDDGRWPDPVRRTPDDTWTAYDLVGGHVPTRDGDLRWAPGVVLDALASDRWLILDEINRAEMDKIFGPLMSFLAGEPVEVGTTTPEDGAPRISLEWSSGPRCEVVPSEGLAGDDDVAFLAGTDWRLLGTYNPQDADRVFGIGQALSRRFREVPIPALPPEEFPGLLRDVSDDLEDDVIERVVGLYEAHFQSRRTRLGPALFVEIARYAQSALSADDEGADLEQFVAEGYVVTVGRHAATYRPEELAELGETPEVEAAVGGEWEWVTEQIENLR